MAVDGHLEWREWETAEQNKRQAVSIVAESVQFLDGANGAGAQDSGEGGAQGDGELVGVGASGGEEVVF